MYRWSHSRAPSGTSIAACPAGGGRRRAGQCWSGGETEPGGGIVPGPEVLQDSALGSTSSSGLASDGGVRNAGGPSRSSMSSRFLAFASLKVMAGRFHLASTSAQMLVWSWTWCDTWCGRDQGETITNGTRNPYLAKPSNVGCPAGTAGGMSSGGIAGGGGTWS